REQDLTRLSRPGSEEKPETDRTHPNIQKSMRRAVKAGMRGPCRMKDMTTIKVRGRSGQSEDQGQDDEDSSSGGEHERKLPRRIKRHQGADPSSNRIFPLR